MRNSLVLVVAVVSLSVGVTRAGIWTTIPIGTPYGISGDIIVDRHGTYDITTQETIPLDPPGSINTVVTGIDGSNVVGRYLDSSNQQYSFLYNGSDWEILDLPSYPTEIDGDNIIGHGNWVYNMTTQSITAFAFPGADFTRISGIDGDKIVGYYLGADDKNHGFFYNGASWITLDPSLPGLPTTHLYGISGDYILGLGSGSSNNNHGLLYNIIDKNWIVLDFPDAIETNPSAIDGNRIVGDYETETHSVHSFLYVTPEPMTLLLFGLGAIFIRKNVRNHK